MGAGGYKCYCIGTNFYGDNCQIGTQGIPPNNLKKNLAFGQSYLLFSECPSKIGENALGLDDDYLPLECQFK